MEHPKTMVGWLLLLFVVVVVRTLRGLRLILKFLTHLEEQKLKICASFRMNVEPWPGYFGLPQNQHFSTRIATTQLERIDWTLDAQTLQDDRIADGNGYGERKG